MGYLRDCGCHEQRRRVVGHLRDTCGDVALDNVKARLSKAIDCVAVGSHEAAAVLERLEYRRVKRIAKLIGRLEQHRHAHRVGDGAGCRGERGQRHAELGDSPERELNGAGDVRRLLSEREVDFGRCELFCHEFLSAAVRRGFDLVVCHSVLLAYINSRGHYLTVV